MADQEALLKIVWNQFKRSKDHWAEDHNNMDTWDKYWERSEDVVPTSEDWEERIHIPLVFNAEQVLTPRIHSVITATNPPFDVVGVEQSDTQGANAIKNLEAHHFDLSNFNGKSIYYVRQAAVRGTTIAEVFWHRKERYITTKAAEEEEITQKDPITGENRVIGMETVTRKRSKDILVKNHPDFEVWSVKDAFPDPDSLSFDDDLPFIRRQKISIDKLREWNESAEALGIPVFENLDKLEEDILKKAKKPDEEMPQMQMNITLLHYWGLINLSDYGIEGVPDKNIPAWITVGYTDNNDNDYNTADKYFMRSIKNPYWHGKPPYVKSVWIKKKTPSWFGVGIPEVGQSSADRVNKIVNMRMDNIKRIINKRFFFDYNDTNLDINAAESGEPGIGIGMRDTQRSMVWEQVGDVTQSSYVEERMAKEDFREATGAVAAISPGTKGEQHSTVRGMMLLQGQAGERLKIIATDIELTFNKEMAQMYHELSKQYLKERQVFDVLGEDGKYYPFEVSPEDIIAKVNFRTTGVSEIVAREMQVNQLLQFKQLTLDDPTVNKAEINKRIAILFGFKDLDKLIREMTPEQEMMLRQNARAGGTRSPVNRSMPSPEGGGRPPGEEALGLGKSEEELASAGMGGGEFGG
jgi:hypothetical protein